MENSCDDDIYKSPSHVKEYQFLSMALKRPPSCRPDNPLIHDRKFEKENELEGELSTNSSLGSTL